jgi:hypothetical protein
VDLLDQGVERRLGLVAGAKELGDERGTAEALFGLALAAQQRGKRTQRSPVAAGAGTASLQKRAVL